MLVAKRLVRVRVASTVGFVRSAAIGSPTTRRMRGRAAAGADLRAEALQLGRDELLPAPRARHRDEPAARRAQGDRVEGARDDRPAAVGAQLPGAIEAAPRESRTDARYARQAAVESAVEDGEAPAGERSEV